MAGENEENEEMALLLERQHTERKEFKAKNSDKKKKREVSRMVVRLEKELTERHQAEVDSLLSKINNDFSAMKVRGDLSIG
ncbi:unnamed protein product [Soboliphyme baturini]|uniref:BZIP domain-containing protein n=1 Tax=Soboliphyme baturini TaxID=241478 RepID=A0A183IF69_9BILA|nr:unnamed protein product [Soboliphyme baturini]